MSIRVKHLAAVGAAVALFLLGQQAAAQTSHGASCPSQCDCGHWEIGTHALYFTPLACPYAYANTVTATVVAGLNLQSGQVQIVPCRADWGFRVFGNYFDGCIFVGLSYQWFEVTATRSIVANNLRILGGNQTGPGKATGQTGIEYQNVDLRVEKYLRQGCGFSLYLYGNARWVDLSHRRAVRVFFTNAISEDIREKSQLEGGAIGIGFGGEFDVWCGVGAFIDGNVLGVIGKRSLKDVRYTRSQANGFTERQESYPSDTCVIPEVDCRIGVNYTYACGCWKVVGEVGYEIDYFWHGSVFPELVGVNLVNVFNGREFAAVCEDLGFSGLFFGGRLIF